MAGYTRQSAASIVAGAEITAAPLNAEFNQLQSAFHATTGHAHDGSSGNGPLIVLTTSVSGILPVANGGTGTAGTGLTLTSTDAGAAAGPDITLYRNSASPAASDIIGRLLLQGEDSAGNTEDYAEIYGVIDDPTSTSEDASWVFRTKVAGTMTTGFTLTGLSHHYPSGSIQNWSSGDVTLTHSANALTWAGATTYTFDTDLRITTAGTNTASAVTVGGTQTLTNKTLTTPTLTSPTISTSPTAAGATWTNLGTVTTADINGGTIDGTVIGGASAAAITGTTITGTTLTGTTVTGSTLAATSTVTIASGGTVNWDSGDVILTHSANTLTWTGASSGYLFDSKVGPNANDAAALGSATVAWSDVFLASGAVLNFDNGNSVITHSSAILTVSTGDLRVTTAGTNSASVVTVGGTQTLTNKTLTTPTLTLKQSSGPTPTAEGDIQWDTDDDAIVVGNGSTQKIFRPDVWEHISTFSGTDLAGGIQFTNLSAYRIIRVSGYIYVGGDGENVILRTSTNNGSSFDSGASDYSWNVLLTSNTTVSGAVDTADTSISLASVGSDTEERLVLEFMMFEFNQAAYMYLTGKNFSISATPTHITRVTSGRRLQATARDAFALIADTSGIISGYIVVEGIRG